MEQTFENRCSQSEWIQWPQSKCIAGSKLSTFRSQTWQRYGLPVFGGRDVDLELEESERMHTLFALHVPLEPRCLVRPCLVTMIPQEHLTSPARRSWVFEAAWEGWTEMRWDLSSDGVNSCFLSGQLEKGQWYLTILDWKRWAKFPRKGSKWGNLNFVKQNWRKLLAGSWKQVFVVFKDQGRVHGDGKRQNSWVAIGVEIWNLRGPKNVQSALRLATKFVKG